MSTSSPAAEIALPDLAGHPALPGHFPDWPVVPGVVLLDHARVAISRVVPGELLAMPSVKFVSPAEPQARLTVKFSEPTPGKVDFEIHAPGRLVASGQMIFGARG